MSAYSLSARSSSARTFLHELALVGLLGFPSIFGLAAAQRPVASPNTVSSACGGVRTQGIVALRAPAANTALSLCDGYSLASSAGSGSLGTPLALASADFDEDGVPDLVSGFSSGSGGSVVIHRGNITALWPYGAAIQNGAPAAFLPNPRTFTVPEATDFVVAGDFDGDGHADIVTAAHGSNGLYLLKGNGRGGFAAAKRIGIAGTVTDMIAGEINRPDGLLDLVVGISGADGSAALVYESPLGALKGRPESFPLNQPVTALALGKFSGSTMRDLAIGSGNELTLIHGRDRRLSSSNTEPVAPAVVTKQNFAFNIRALASGDFTGRGPSVAALGDDGSVHVMEHAVSAEVLADTLGTASAAPTMQVSGDEGGSAKPMGSAVTSSVQTRLAAVRQMAISSGSSNTSEWTERSTIALPGGFSQTTHGLIAARISGSLQEDLLVVDSANSQVHVLSSLAGQKQLKAMSGQAGSLTRNIPQMSMLASLAATNAPAAVLPMRLSQHGLSGLVALQTNMSSPIVMPHDVAPTAVFTVTNTSDITSASQKNSPPDGSLRAAMLNAQSASGTNGGGTYSIVFNIPTSDPGYNAATGIFKIQPLSENVPGSLDNFALPPINATLTIDGYTQPGASPNTATTSDNAKILIQIDGSKATTPGGSGFVPFDDIGTVIRGIAFTGWANPAITSSSSGSTASGAEGIEANGVGDFIEGNYFGTADGTTDAPNRIGIFADNGPLFGTAPGNTIGGTTPQARNVLSGNNNSGILFLSTAYEAQLQGNFIGLDVTGRGIVSNPQQATRSNTFDGVGLNGSTVTIGGTVPGAGNVISGNGTNIDINDLTNGGAARNSLVVGNLIGTDGTGTKAIAGQGYGVSILHSVTFMTIGGTTPAGRNIISGNLAGVYIYDNSFSNVVQGNFIGTDVTGTVAVPNVGQGFISGRTVSTAGPAASNTIGGTVAGSGNLISGNGSDAIQINGTYSSSPGFSPYQGNTVQGNFIGTDVTGTKPLPNQGNGVSILLGGTNNTIGGSSAGLGNVIANNTANGILIDPGTGNGPAVNNVTVANTIYSNTGAGVRIKSGTANRISANSIYSNSALGIDIDAAGPGTNTHCNATNTGANGLQNYPVLTGGSGTTYITATATDPNGNTSEFSKAVPATQTANLVSLLGSFDGTASTKFTLEFFSNPTADASGYGQGQTYLGSTTITTDANCSGTITNPVDLTQADVSVSLAESTRFFSTGPDNGLYTYTATVTNNGPATAHSVVMTDVLPAQLQVSSTYCNVGQCQSPITTSQGTCTVSGKTITCNLGTMPTGETANITIPVQALVTGSITNTVNVTATETDPNLLNNVSSQTASATDPYPFVDHLNPAAVLVNNPDLVLDIFGTGFTPNMTATFNSVPVRVVGYVDNQVCGGAFSPSFCSDLQVLIPAAQLTTAGAFTVAVSNLAGNQGSATLTVAAACTYSVFASLDTDYENSGTNLIAGAVYVTTNIPSCPWTATSSVPWASILDNVSGVGSGTVDVAIAPNTTTSTRAGSVTVAGTTTNFTQDAGSASICSVALDPATVAASAAGGAGSINATLSNSSCAPFAEPYPISWVKITSKSNLLVASGPVTYTLSPNNGPARVGSVVVGGNATTITQAAPSCYFTLSANSALAPSAGSTGSITVTPTPSACSWTATSSNTSQVSVTSGASGTGNGTVNYTVAQNNGGPITPTITIGNSAATSIFTVNQASAFTCTFTLSPTPVSVSSNGTSNLFTVTASFGTCKWTAASNNPEGLTITTGASKTGSGNVFYSVAKNTTGAPRTLTITAGCQTFIVNQDGAIVPNNPTPALTSLQPSSVTTGSAAFTLTVNGTGFVSGSVVNLNGSPRTTTYVSATQLTAAIPASDITTTGSAAITVTTPTPGGGTSNSLTLTITSASNNPVPVLTSLQPASATAGSAAFTLTVNGTGFISGSIVNFNGSARPTTYVSATQVAAAILASDVATAGTSSVTVANATPGGGTSNALTFTVNAASNPAPTLTALQPSSATAGSAAFTLTVTGTNFLSGSVINFGGTALATTYVSATQLTGSVPASAIGTAGTSSVTVTNPAPGGGTSNALTFTINAVAVNNPVPTLTTLQPSSTTAGSATFTLTVTGTNFLSSSVISFGGTALTTTYVSTTQLTASVPASAVAAVGTPTVTVANPTPGGGTSNALTFTITAANNPMPTLTTLQPASVTVGSAAFTLTVNGTNFISSSKVNFNGTALTTTYVSATQLTAAVPASNVASTGTPAITVTTPTPGGGTSNSLTLSVTAAAAPTYTLGSSGAQTITPGQTAQYTITSTAMNGTYGTAIVLSASGLPTGATATFSPTSITPNATTAQSTLTISVPQTAASLSHSSSGLTWAFLGVPFLGLLILPKAQRKRFIAAGTLMLGLLVSVGTFTGCGANGFNYTSVSPQTFNVIVTGTSGPVTVTTTVQLTVNYTAK